MVLCDVHLQILEREDLECSLKLVLAPLRQIGLPLIADNYDDPVAVMLEGSGLELVHLLASQFAIVATPEDDEVLRLFG